MSPSPSGFSTQTGPIASRGMAVWAYRSVRDEVASSAPRGVGGPAGDQRGLQGPGRGDDEERVLPAPRDHPAGFTARPITTGA